MGYATLRMSGKEFVLVPKSEFRRLTRQDRLDAAKAGKALTRWRGGKLATTSHEDLKKKLGL
jgi:hypothetical protein